VDLDRDKLLILLDLCLDRKDPMEMEMEMGMGLDRGILLAILPLSVGIKTRLEKDQ
jgi:hypothetical protein